MQITTALRWLGAAGFLIAIIALSGMHQLARAGEEDWLHALSEAVLAEQAKEGSEAGLFAPYVDQLSTVRSHLRKGEDEAVYRAMNRFMDMLQARDQGIAADAAERLFDYCYLVTPARYHDVSRHLHRLSRYQVPDAGDFWPLQQQRIARLAEAISRGSVV